MTLWTLDFERAAVDRIRFFGVRTVAGVSELIRDKSGRVIYRYDERAMELIVNQHNRRLLRAKPMIPSN